MAEREAYAGMPDLLKTRRGRFSGKPHRTVAEDSFSISAWEAFRLVAFKGRERGREHLCVKVDFARCEEDSSDKS